MAIDGVNRIQTILIPFEEPQANRFHYDLISRIKVQDDDWVEVIRPLLNREWFNDDAEMGRPKTDGLRTEIKKVMLAFRGMLHQHTVS